jgi:hypothetical protein
MPGFVDVSNMTSEQVRRLGHADDDYEDTPVRYKSQRVAPATVSIKELAALAFAAQRVNGALHKYDTVFDEATGDSRKVIPNKTLMYNTFAGVRDNQLTVTQEDQNLAQQAVDSIQADITISILKNQKVSDFIQSLNVLLTKETATQRDCGLMAFLPQVYARSQERAVKQEAMAEIGPGSQYLGKVGDKVTVNFEFIEQRYLQQYNCFAVFGTDGAGNCVKFLTAHKELAKSAQLQGKIKRLEEDRYRGGAKVTTLNYVKEIT